MVALEYAATLLVTVIQSFQLLTGVAQDVTLLIKTDLMLPMILLKISTITKLEGSSLILEPLKFFI
jgi:hypothetical protein